MSEADTIRRNINGLMRAREENGTRINKEKNKRNAIKISFNRRRNRFILQMFS